MAMPRWSAALLLLVGSCGAAGCGDAATPNAAVPKATKVKVVAKSSPAASVNPTSARHRAVVARIDASSDEIVAEGKLHIAAGAPSDAEIRREIAAARKAGIVLPSGESAASFENAPSNSPGAGTGAETPEAVWNPRSKPIAGWIIPVLQRAGRRQQSRDDRLSGRCGGRDQPLPADRCPARLPGAREADWRRPRTGRSRALLGHRRLSRAATPQRPAIAGLSAVAIATRLPAGSR
jgi:hypothetical protein